MRKFKVGDRVISLGLNLAKEGYVGTVLGYYCGDVCVRFDKDMGGHDFSHIYTEGISCDFGHGYIVMENYLELYIPKKWAVRITKSNVEILKEWVLSKIPLKSIWRKKWLYNSDIMIGLFCCDHFDSSFYISTNSLEGFVYQEISIEDFKKHIMKQEVKKLYTIEDLRKGRCAIINDGSVIELQEVIKEAFPIDNQKPSGIYSFYMKSSYREGKWCCDPTTDLPTQSVKEFLKQIEMKEQELTKEQVEAKVVDFAKKVEWDFLKVQTFVGGGPGGLIHIEYLKLDGSFSKEKAELILERFKPKTERFPFKLDFDKAKSIVDIACVDWKPKLKERWAEDLLAYGHVDISEVFYKQMRKACTTSQHNLFDEIFGKDESESPYEDGELIFVRYDSYSEWLLRYTTGKFDSVGNIACYSEQRNSGKEKYFKFHAKAESVKLPV